MAEWFVACLVPTIAPPHSALCLCLPSIHHYLRLQHAHRGCLPHLSQHSLVLISGVLVYTVLFFFFFFCSFTLFVFFLAPSVFLCLTYTLAFLPLSVSFLNWLVCTPSFFCLSHAVSMCLIFFHSFSLYVSSLCVSFFSVIHIDTDQSVLSAFLVDSLWSVSAYCMY